MAYDVTIDRDTVGIVFMKKIISLGHDRTDVHLLLEEIAVHDLSRANNIRIGINWIGLQRYLKTNIGFDLRQILDVHENVEDFWKCGAFKTCPGGAKL